MDLRFLLTSDNLKPQCNTSELFSHLEDRTSLAALLGGFLIWCGSSTAEHSSDTGKVEGSIPSRTTCPRKLTDKLPRF